MNKLFYFILFYLLLSSHIFYAKEYNTELVIGTQNTAVGSTNSEEYTGSLNTILISPNDNKNTILDFVEEDSDIDIRQAGSLGTISTISIRGSSPSEVNVYLDGVLLNTASTGFVNLSNFNPHILEKIEIYKGVVPVNLGIGSMGGAINLITKKISKPSISLMYKLGDLIGTDFLLVNKRLLFSANLFFVPNDFKFLNDNGTKYNNNDDKIQNRYNNEVLELNLLTKYKIIKTNNFNLGFSLNYFKKFQNLPTWNNIQTPETFLAVEKYLASLNGEYLGLIPNKFILTYTYDNQLYQDPLGLIGLGIQNNSYKTNILSYKHYFEYFVTNNGILKANIFSKKEWYNVKNNLSNFAYNTSTRDNVSGALEFYNKFKQFSFNLSGIFEIYNDILNANTSITTKYTVFEPRFGIKYNILKKQSLNLLAFSNIGKYFRPATFYELFGDRGFVVGNPDLKPEHSINFDLGLKFSLFNFEFSSSYFVNNIDDAISYVYDSRGIGKAINFSTAQVQGLENTVNYKYKSFLLKFNYTHKKPIVMSGIYKAKVLAGRYKNKIFCKLSYDIKLGKAKLILWYSFLFTNGMFFDSINILRADDKYIHSVGFRYLQNIFYLGFYIKNLLNKNYQDYHNFYSAGRVYYLSFGLKV